jgi:hypothetical protein
MQNKGGNYMRKNMIMIGAGMMLQKTIEDFYKKSRLVKYFTENPIKDHAK